LYWVVVLLNEFYFWSIHRQFTDIYVEKEKTRIYHVIARELS
jgi:hypothetical protein